MVVAVAVVAILEVRLLLVAMEVPVVVAQVLLEQVQQAQPTLVVVLAVAPIPQVEFLEVLES